MTMNEDSLKVLKDFNMSIENFMNTDYVNQDDFYGDASRIVEYAYSTGMICASVHNRLLDLYGSFDEIDNIQEIDPRFFFYEKYTDVQINTLTWLYLFNVINKEQFMEFNQPDVYNEEFLIHYYRYRSK